MNDIRVIVLGLIKDKERIFVAEGYDIGKRMIFYRALGGGIEFGETSKVALIREFREEINAELTNINYLGCMENLFIYNGKKKHEIIQLYQCDFADPKFYQLESVVLEKKHKARWVEISKFKSGELMLTPKPFFDYL